MLNNCHRLVFHERHKLFKIQGSKALFQTQFLPLLVSVFLRIVVRFLVLAFLRKKKPYSDTLLLIAVRWTLLISTVQWYWSNDACLLIVIWISSFAASFPGFIVLIERIELDYWRLGVELDGGVSTSDVTFNFAPRSTGVEADSFPEVFRRLTSDWFCIMT